ncbi:MAG: hypothetical protein ACYSVY_20385, partial [Planctomycetota bacterium]
MSRPKTRLALPLVLLSAVVIGNCSDGTLSGPEDRQQLTPPAPSFDISDAAHGGNAHFFWLPPMVDDPGAFNGPFDGTLSPVVHICDLTDCAA